MLKRSDLPQNAIGKQSRISIINVIMETLLQTTSGGKPVALSFPELGDAASKARGYKVAQPTIRSIIYQNISLFERVTTDKRVRWRLSEEGRKLWKVKAHQN